MVAVVVVMVPVIMEEVWWSRVVFNAAETKISS